jgi:hypothetical protein
VHGATAWLLVGLTVALVGAFAAGVLWLSRLRTLNRRLGSVSCSLADGESGPWRRGIAQYGRARMYWWRRNSLAPRAAAVWARAGIAVLERHALPAPPGRPPAVLARCRVTGPAGPAEVCLQMSADAFAGFTSWIEATPTSVGAVI